MKLDDFAILASKKDPAALNISKELEKLGIKVNYLEQDSIYSENIDKQINGEFYIFVSKHKSEKNLKSLTVHAPGNWHSADLGGKPGKVCKTSAFFLKHIFQILNKKAKASGLDYQVSLEVTHHGPYLENPCCFIEIGSSEQEWKDEKAAKVIAETINDAMFGFDKEKLKENWKSVILIGGGHYNQTGNKIMLNTDYAIGHIIPKYQFPLTLNMLNEAINKTIPHPAIILLDWKGLGSYKKEIIQLLEERNLKYERV